MGVEDMLRARTQRLYLLVHPQYLLVHRSRVLVLLVPLLLLSALVSSLLSAPQRVWLLLLLLLRPHPFACRRALRAW